MKMCFRRGEACLARIVKILTFKPNGQIDNHHSRLAIDRGGSGMPDPYKAIRNIPGLQTFLQSDNATLIWEL
jgi:hypothetical protein